MVFILCARAPLLDFWGAVMEAYVVFARAVLDLAKSGFCKFIGSFLVPASTISFGEFFLKFGNTVKPAFGLMMDVSNLLTRSCNTF